MKKLTDNYVLYRLPDENTYTRLTLAEGSPEKVASVAMLGRKDGFVMAPFMNTANHPVLLFQADSEEQLPVSAPDAAWQCPKVVKEQRDREAYHTDFNFFHELIKREQYDKLVLSRRLEIELEGEPDAEQLFFRACANYPHQFIALVHLDEAGTWLMATPELLLSGNGQKWHTMALAGTQDTPIELKNCDTAANDLATMPIETLWTEKNRKEQAYVADYMERCLTRHCTDIVRTLPYTTQAAKLLHLRSDFSFRLPKGVQLGPVIDDLYPTPAVCGLPKNEARRLILSHESVDRSYYSGFCGPLSATGPTHLFVSLRCMEIKRQQCTLYAGGGLLAASDEEAEWQETEAKLMTMRRLLENPS